MVKRALGRRASVAVKLILFLAALYNIYTLGFAVYDVYRHMLVNLLYALSLAFILYPGSRGSAGRVP